MFGLGTLLRFLNQVRVPIHQVAIGMQIIKKITGRAAATIRWFRIEVEDIMASARRVQTTIRETYYAGARAADVETEAADVGVEVASVVIEA